MARAVATDTRELAKVPGLSEEVREAMARYAESLNRSAAAVEEATNTLSMVDAAVRGLSARGLVLVKADLEQRLFVHAL